MHLFWALGGATGLASSAGEELAAERPVWFVVFGLGSVAVLLVAAAAIGVSLTRARCQRRFVLAAAVIGLLLVLRGLAIEVLLLSGAYDGNTAISPDERHWSLVLWNPWFVLGGAAFLLAVVGRPTGGRRWVRGRG